MTGVGRQDGGPRAANSQAVSGPASGSDFRMLGDLLGEVDLLRAGGESEDGRRADTAPRAGDPVRRLAALWAEIVGPEIAENAQPVQLKNGRLVVATSSSAWAQTLQLMGEDIRTRVNGCLRADAVRDIGFRHAGWESRPPRATGGESPQPDRPATADLSTEQRTALEELSILDLDPELKDKIIRAMQAAFVRGEQD
jgi:hypothetical protein